MSACSIRSGQGNIGCGGQNNRLRGGVIGFSLALVIAVVMLKLGAGTPYRLALFVPFLGASSGIYQGLFKTCSFLAARGQRNMDDGPEPIIDPEELRGVKAGARRVFALTFATALTATSLFVLAP